VAGSGSGGQTAVVGFEAEVWEIVRETGAYALLVLFGASLAEYVFPPFPGDAITLLGAFYAVQGVLSLPLVFLVVTAGSVAGAALDYAIGRRLGAAAERRLPGENPKHPWFSLDRLHVFEERYRKHGDLFIVVNRFLPGIRGFFFVAAGAAGMPLRRVLVLGAVSAAVWNGLILAAGYAVGENLARLIELSRTYSVLVWVAIGVVVAGFVAYRAFRWVRRRPRRQGRA
jgi:membrane protein DedA with SNARE-associated domain